jgi:YD repeat-containing protein
MKRLLYLLLLLAACKSSSSDKEVDRIAVITEQVLNEDFTTPFRPETFQGDIEHISEVFYAETKAGDGYIERDTVSKEYFFKDHRLYQVATSTRGTKYDTLTIRYDTAGRILALIYSDDYRTYNTDRFRYDAAGRRIEKVNRFFTTESHRLYKYSKTGDTLLISSENGRNTQRIMISEKRGILMVTHQMLNDDSLSWSREDEYNRLNQLVGMYTYTNGKADYKVIKKYDSYGNIVWWEHYLGDRLTKDGFGEVDKSISLRSEYEYDKKGNWTIEKTTPLDKSWTSVTTRKISYR